MATVADHVISALRISGVRRVYGLPGDSLNGFTDAHSRRSGEMSWEHVRHEETAAFAAAAEAALTGQLAVCAGSCGPGNLHLINGLFDAQRSRVPVLGDRGAHPAHRDRLRVLPGDPPAGAVPGMQCLLRTGQHPRDDAADPRDGDAGGRRRARRGRGGHPRRGLSAPRRRVRVDGPSGRCDPFGGPSRRRVGAAGCRDPQRRQRCHHPRWGRCRRSPRRGDCGGGDVERADRACVARQGVHRVRQPVRRRDDRPAGIRLGL